MVNYIDKEDLLEAVAFEPLDWGCFWGPMRADGSCKACVVGRTLAKAGLPELMIPGTAAASVQACVPSDVGHLPGNNWLSAASVYWESLARLPLPEARRHLLDWIEFRVPADVNLLTGEGITE